MIDWIEGWGACIDWEGVCRWGGGRGDMVFRDDLGFDGIGDWKTNRDRSGHRGNAEGRGASTSRG